MRYRELLEAKHVNFYWEIEKAAAAAGSPTANDNGRTIYPEFSKADIRSASIRFAVSGKAEEFIQKSATQKWLADNGWMVTVLRPHHEKYGLDANGQQKYRDYLEVRLEHVDGELLIGQNRPSELFHVTPAENVPSILKNGLQPRRPSRPEMHRYEPRIFFATSLEGAERIQRNFVNYDAKQGAEQNWVILTVNPNEVGDLFTDQEFRRDGVFTTEAVPASAISQNLHEANTLQKIGAGAALAGSLFLGGGDAKKAPQPQPTPIHTVSQQVPVPLNVQAIQAAVRSTNIRDSRVLVLALTMWGEARSAGDQGMKAIGHVIVNRVKDAPERFGSKIAQVVMQRKQFTCWHDKNLQKMAHVDELEEGSPDYKMWQRAVKDASDIISGHSRDITHGALYYHTDDINPSWADAAKVVAKIGNHLFYRNAA